MITFDMKPVILVTGSSGLIGTRVLEAFSADYNVVGLDVKAPDKIPAGTDFIECDLTDDKSVARSLNTVRERAGNLLSSVIHLAAYYDFSGEPSPLYRELTVEGTRRLLRALRQFQVEQFVFSSSLLVMKPVEKGEMIRETSPVEAEWDYPQSKLEAERVIEEERGDIPAIILRIAGTYDEDGHSLPVAQQISRIYEKQFESYFFPGNQDHGQAFVHLNDLIECLQKVVELRNELDRQEMFLIAEPDLMSYGELQDTLGELIHGEEWPTIRIPKIVAKAGAWAREKMAGEDETFIKPWMIDLADAHYPVDISKARRMLGWEPAHLLRNTLGEMIARLKRDPERWYAENNLPLPEDKEKEASAR